jgi:hypothetical protein
MTRWTTLVPEAYVQLTKPAATLKRTAGPSGSMVAWRRCVHLLWPEIPQP